MNDQISLGAFTSVDFESARDGTPLRDPRRPRPRYRPFAAFGHFRELLNNSMEGIASNILADRLRRLTSEGVISKADDPSHKQKAIYSLTEKGIELVPVFAMIGAWGSKWLPVTEELSIRAKILAEGGPSLWEDFMDDLRVTHLGAPPNRDKKGPGVGERLQAAYEAVVARQSEADQS